VGGKLEKIATFIGDIFMMTSLNKVIHDFFKFDFVVISLRAVL